MITHSPCSVPGYSSPWIRKKEHGVLTEACNGAIGQAMRQQFAHSATDDACKTCSVPLPAPRRRSNHCSSSRRRQLPKDAIWRANADWKWIHLAVGGCVRRRRFTIYRFSSAVCVHTVLRWRCFMAMCVIERRDNFKKC